MHTDIFDGSWSDCQGHECKLQIRLPHTGAAAQKSTCLKMIGSSEAPKAGKPTQPREYLSHAAIDVVNRNRLETAMLDNDVWVIVEVRAHGGQFHLSFNAKFGQLGGSSNTGQLQ